MRLVGIWNVKHEVKLPSCGLQTILKSTSVPVPDVPDICAVLVHWGDCHAHMFLLKMEAGIAYTLVTGYFFFVRNEKSQNQSLPVCLNKVFVLQSLSDFHPNLYKNQNPQNTAMVPSKNTGRKSHGSRTSSPLHHFWRAQAEQPWSPAAMEPCSSHAWPKPLTFAAVALASSSMASKLPGASERRWKSKSLRVFFWIGFVDGEVSVCDIMWYTLQVDFGSSWSTCTSCSCKLWKKHIDMSPYGNSRVFGG